MTHFDTPPQTVVTIWAVYFADDLPVQYYQPIFIISGTDSFKWLIPVLYLQATLVPTLYSSAMSIHISPSSQHVSELPGGTSMCNI